MSETPLLSLPILEASQAQKHVTHNEALMLLDAALQLSVKTRNALVAPGGAAEGDRYLLGAAPTGVWNGKGGKLACYQAGGWVFSQPREGWRLWAEDEDKLYVYDGAIWRDILTFGEISSVSQLGVNTSADASNRLAVSSPAVLLTHAGSDQRLKINKNAAANTGSLLLQTNFAGRAELGLTGDDNFHLKVSADGSSWTEAMVVDRTTGAVTLPNTASGDAHATRAGFAAAVAGGMSRGDGTITYADGLAYRWKAGATSIPGLPGLVPAFEDTIRHYGAVADGATDAGPAIQAAVDAVAAAGGGVVLCPAGTFALATTVVLKTGVTLRGVPRGTVFRPSSSFPSTGYPIINQDFTINDYTTRLGRDLGVEGITFDGSQRSYALYPAPGYANQAGMILLGRCERPFVRNCVFRDYRAGWGIVAQGNRGAAFQDNEFLRMGKQDSDTGGILNINYGSSVRNVITAISKANPCVITFAYPHDFTVGPKYLRGVRGMTQLTDGEYNVTAVTTTTATLGAINSSAYSDFVFDAESEMTDRFMIRGEGTVITGNRFIDLFRTAVSDSGDGTKIIGNHVDGAGETGFYLNFAKNAIVSDNTIRNVALNDVSGCCIEINWGVNHIIRGNQLSRAECSGIACNGMVGGSITGNVIKECGFTPSVVYPVAPTAAAQGLVGTPLVNGKRAAIFVTSYQDWPVKDVDISGNDLIDTRTGAAMLTTHGIFVTKNVGNNKNLALRLVDNRFAGLTALAEANWHFFISATLAQGCWVEYQHPVTGQRVLQEQSGSGGQTIAAPLALSGTLSLSGSGQSSFNELVDDRVAAMLTAGSNISLTYNDVANTLTVAASGAGGVSDGDKGDIAVSGAGTAWAIDADAVDNTKLRNSSATSVIGRSAATAGDPADIQATADGHYLKRAGGTLGFGVPAAADIANAAAGTIAATTVQAAINELDTEKLARGGDAMTGKLTLPAATTSGAGLNIGNGTTPTAPVDGDVWGSTSGLFYKVPAGTYTVLLSNALQTVTAKKTFSASAAGGALLALSPGVDPSSPANGDIWTTATDLKIRLNGTTITLNGAGGGSGVSAGQYRRFRTMERMR